MEILISQPPGVKWDHVTSFSQGIVLEVKSVYWRYETFRSLSSPAVAIVRKPLVLRIETKDGSDLDYQVST